MWLDCELGSQSTHMIHFYLKFLKRYIIIIIFIQIYNIENFCTYNYK